MVKKSGFTQKETTMITVENSIHRFGWLTHFNSNISNMLPKTKYLCATDLIHYLNNTKEFITGKTINK